MKKFLIAVTLAAVSVSSMAADQSCIDLVHSRTMAPVKEMSNTGVGKDGYQTIARAKGDFYTYYQCDGKGNYRQFMDKQWSIWRTGNEWNAVHWMQF